MATGGARVLVVEDHPNMRLGIRSVLHAAGFDVLEAADGVTGLRLARESRPDLVVLDLMLPALSGPRVLGALRDEGCQVPVLVLTARGDEADKVRGLELGADDYVTKPFGRAELVARVHALLRRARLAAPPAPNAPAAPATIAFGDVVVDPAAHAVTRGGAPVALTPKEYALLLALARRGGAAATRAELLREVWGHRVEVVTRTVDLHVLELRRKLEPDPARPRHILTVRKTGYRFAS